MPNDIRIDRLIAQHFLRPGDVVIDGGAHDGSTAAMFIDEGASRVLAFEPVAELRQSIALYFDSYRLKLPNVDVWPVALSNRRGQALLRLSTAHDEGSTVNPVMIDLFPDVYGEYTGRMVSTMPLDDLVGMVCPDYIKLDVEGAEAWVLRGAQQLYAGEHPPRVTVCEIYPPVREEGLALLREYHKRLARVFLDWNDDLAFELPGIGVYDDLPPCPPMFVGWNE